MADKLVSERDEHGSSRRVKQVFAKVSGCNVLGFRVNDVKIARPARGQVVYDTPILVLIQSLTGSTCSSAFANSIPLVTLKG